MNIHSLILWGLILCAGDAKLKARVFYDVLQDSLQTTISANDKDFKGNFDKLIQLATLLPYQYESEINGGEKTNGDKINEDLLEKIGEEFLDAIFDANAKISRQEYLDLIAQKQSWIFSAKQIREKVDKS